MKRNAPRTFGAVCATCNHGYRTKYWEAPWRCPNCRRRGEPIYAAVGEIGGE